MVGYLVDCCVRMGLIVSRASCDVPDKDFHSFVQLHCCGCMLLGWSPELDLSYAAIIRSRSHTLQ